MALTDNCSSSERLLYQSNHSRVSSERSSLFTQLSPKRTWLSFPALLHSKLITFSGYEKSGEYRKTNRHHDIYSVYRFPIKLYKTDDSKKK